MIQPNFELLEIEIEQAKKRLHRLKEVCKVIKIENY